MWLRRCRRPHRAKQDLCNSDLPKSRKTFYEHIYRDGNYRRHSHKGKYCEDDLRDNLYEVFCYFSFKNIYLCVTLKIALFKLIFSHF